MSQEFADASRALIQAGQRIAAKGLVPATSGNFSQRLENGDIAITRSGADKGNLTLDSIMRVDAAGSSLDQRTPSAETLLHTQIYQHYPRAKAVLHTHSVNATVLSQLKPNGVTLANYEILKAFAHIQSHQSELVVPVVANDQTIPRLAEQVLHYIQGHDELSAYLIEGHGLYTWAESLEQAFIQTEAMEFLFSCELLKMRIAT